MDAPASKRRPTSRVYRYPEVARFVDECLDRDRMTYTEAAAACRRRFGPERAPSRSAIQRYFHSRRPSPTDNRN